jgi:hypothetical protein
VFNVLRININDKLNQMSIRSCINDKLVVLL